MIILLVMLAGCGDDKTPSGSDRDTAPSATTDTDAPTGGSSTSPTAGTGTGASSGTSMGTGTGTGTGTGGTVGVGCGVVDVFLGESKAPGVHLAWSLTVTSDEPGRLTLTLDDVPLVETEAGTEHMLPILGLRADSEHVIGWTLTCDDAVMEGEIPLETAPFTLPWPDATLFAASDVGLTLIDMQSMDLINYVALIHADGSPAWVLETEEKVVDVRAYDGHLIGVEKFDVVEWSWLGEELVRYSPDPDADDIPVDTYGFHHEVFPTGDGFVALSTGSKLIPGFPSGYMSDETETRMVEDNLIVDVAPDGTIRSSQSLLSILDPTRIGWGSLNSATLGVDWAHSNAVVIEPVTGDRIVSARHQGAVVRFGADDTIKWILADPGGWGPAWTDALLTPVGEPFEWPHHQHAPMLHPSGDGRLVVFDNGNYGRRNPYSDEPAGLGNYSRLVEYRVVDGTVEQTWEYVDTLTGRLYASAFGDADYTDSGTILGVWGFLFQEEGIDNSERGLGQKSTRIIEVDPETDEVVWDIRLNSQSSDAREGWQVHRAQRLDDPYAP